MGEPRNRYSIVSLVLHWGIAAAVFDQNGRPAWALSLTGVETRFKADRRQELGTLLLEQAHVLSGRLSS